MRNGVSSTASFLTQGFLFSLPDSCLPALFAAFAEGSTFRKADLSFADLEQGNFEDSDFTDAVLEGAQVSAARFERAVIENSDWTDVVLRKDVQQFLCRKPSAKGTNPVTGADTRESLMC